VTDNELLRALAAELGVSLPAGFHTEHRLYHLEAAGEHAWLASELLVEAWSLQEGLSALYELQLSCLSLQRIDLDALLCEPLHRTVGVAARGGASVRAARRCHRRRPALRLRRRGRPAIRYNRHPRCLEPSRADIGS
jgi:hypothetical protein